MPQPKPRIVRPPRRWARTGVSLLCAMAMAWPAGWAGAQVRLPAMGDTASDDIPLGVERRYGDQVMREVWRDPVYLDDPVLQEYLQSLWTPLLQAARARGDIDDDVWAQFAWRTFLVRDRSVNAFALPGGWVGVHLGLIAMTATEHELAAVLAHELSHVSQRHIARGIASAGRQGTVAMVAMLLGMLAASRSGSSDVAQAAVVGSQAAMMQGQLNFSRDMEREADRIGYGVFRGAGFDSAGMAGMFDKLDQASRLNDSGAFPYLRSHPLTVERLAEAQSRLAPEAGAAARAPGLAHTLMQARARVLLDGSDRGLRHHLDAVAGAAGRDAPPAAWYAAALAATLAKDPAAADRAYAQLQARLADRADLTPALRRLVGLLQVEMLVARAQPQAALSALAALPAEGAAASRAQLRWRAGATLAAVEAGTPVAGTALQELDQALRTWLATERDDAAVWSLLARLAEARGNRLQALRAHAEARAAQGDLAAAIDRLRAAQRVSRVAAGAELVEASVIDARLRELQRRWRELYGDRPPRDADIPG